MGAGEGERAQGIDTRGPSTLHVDEHNQWRINAPPYEAKQRGTET